MTQLVSISANTAALNIEMMRVPRRLAIKDQVKDIKADADREYLRAHNAGEPGDVEMMIPATAVSIDLTTTGQNPHRQATFSQAQSAYRAFED
jgi:hypothetical protein